ncbi:hypothetical protein [Streptomyces sp. NPDC048338]|uniref:hypothetical protein n=1 Tax=Streptomyces sp. NPDC048338 TaxID=3365536 RepID=UPI003713A2E8
MVDVEVAQQFVDVVGAPGVASGGAGDGDDLPAGRSLHGLRCGGRGVGGGPGLGGEAVGGQGDVVQGVPVVCAPAGEFGAELQGAAAAGAVDEAHPVEVAALDEGVGVADAGAQDGLPRAGVPGDGLVPVEVDEDRPSVGKMDDDGGSQGFREGELGLDALGAQPRCQVGFGEEVVGVVLAAVLAAAGAARAAASIVGEVADFGGAQAGRRLPAAAAFELGPAPDGDAGVLTAEGFQLVGSFGAQCRLVRVGAAEDRSLDKASVHPAPVAPEG